MGLPIDPAVVGVAVLQVGILAILAVAVRRGNTAAAVNTLGAFVAVLLPPAVEFVLRVGFARSVSVGPELPLWIAVAGLLHSYGMLGPYDSIEWWDTLTHTVSAALVAALIYAALVVVGRPGGAVALSPRAVALGTVGFTFVIGVFWELIELVAREVGEQYDVEPVLVHYGWRDTALDLVFDAVGALVVVLLDLQVFVPVADQSPGATRTLLVGSGVTVVAGSVLMALGLGLVRDDWAWTG